MARERDPIARVASRRMEAAEKLRHDAGARARACARKSVLWNHGKAPSYPLTAHRGRKGNAATPGRRDCHFERRSPWKSLGPHSSGGGAVPRERGRQSLSASLEVSTVRLFFFGSPLVTPDTSAHSRSRPIRCLRPLSSIRTWVFPPRAVPLAVLHPCHDM